MASSTSIRWLPVAALGLLIAQAALAAPSYRIELLHRGGGISPKLAGSISDNGSVVGVGVDSQTDESTMFRSYRGRKVQGLVESQNVHYPGSPQINDAGVVVGRYQRDYVEYGGMWTRDGELTDLAPLLGCDDSRDIYPKSIDDKGALLLSVTCMANGAKISGGFVVRDGVATQVPASDDKSVAVEAMNRRGQVIGELWNSNYRTQAFIWQEGKPMRRLTPGFDESYANALNDHGHVVGMTVTNLSWHPFLNDGSFKELPKCGTHEIWPMAINNDGWIAGNFDELGPQDAALIRDGQCATLASLLDESGTGWSSLKVDDMNNNGVIVGHGRFEGYRRAFIATPLGR